MATLEQSVGAKVPSLASRGEAIACPDPPGLAVGEDGINELRAGNPRTKPAGTFVDDVDVTVERTSELLLAHD